MTLLTRVAGALFLALSLAAPAAAFDIEAMTDAEREAFRSEVRTYLLANPEVLLEAIQVLEARQAAEQAMADANLVASNAQAIFRDANSYVGGNPDGDVTVVEFLDYRCGYCRRAHPEVKELVASDGNIRYIVKEFPILGEQSVLASRFAISVLEVEGPEAYERTNDALMTFRGNFTEETLTGLSESFGYDTSAVFKMMGDPRVEAVIAQNRQLAQRLQISGTPSFVFDSQLVRGYAPLDAMRGVIEGLRAERG